MTTSESKLKNRIKSLETEVEMLKNQLQKEKQAKKSRFSSALKKALIVVLVIATALFLNLSVASFWVKKNIVESEIWVSKTTQIIQTPSVRQDISDSIAKNIFINTDAKQKIEDILPTEVKALANPLATNLQNFTSKKINEILESPQFIQFWEKSNLSAHQGIIASLESAGNPSQDVSTKYLMYIQKDDLYLNLQPIFDNIKARLSNSGLSFINNVSFNNVNKSIPIAHIKNMQTILLIFDTISKAAIVLPVLALLSAAGAILLSNRKRMVIMSLAIATIVLMVINVQAIYLVKYPFIKEITQALAASNSVSAQSIFSIMFSDLTYYDRLLMLLALAILVGAFVVGPSRFAVWLRGSLANIFAGKINNKYTDWVGKNSTAIITIIAIIAGLLLIFPPVSNVVFMIVNITLAIILSFAVVIIKESNKR